MSASSSAGDFVALAVSSAWASVFVPPQHAIQSGRGSDRPAACRIRSEPAEWSVGPDGVHAVPGLSRHHQRLQGGGLGKSGLMLQQVRPHLGVGVDHRVDDVGPHAVPHPRGRRRHQALDVELVRVDEEPDHRHLVVRLVGDVGKDDDARLRRRKDRPARRADRPAGGALRDKLRRGERSGRDDRARISLSRRHPTRTCSSGGLMFRKDR